MKRRKSKIKIDEKNRKMKIKIRKKDVKINLKEFGVCDKSGKKKLVFISKIMDKQIVNNNRLDLFKFII